MASSTFYNGAQSKEIDTKVLYCKVAIGASGAPTINTAASKGIASIVRDDTGDFTITLSEKYNSLLFANVAFVEANDTDLTWHVSAEAVSSTPSISFVFKAAGTPTDPDNGSTLLFQIVLKNSNI